MIIAILLLIYTLGCVTALQLIDLIEATTKKVFSKGDYTKLVLGSWYSCIVLNNILNKWYD